MSTLGPGYSRAQDFMRTHSHIKGCMCLRDTEDERIDTVEY